MTTRIETPTPVRMRIKRKPPSKPLAECLFGKRFSRLTIEDEYNYNLEYLISENGSTRWMENPKKIISSPCVEKAKYFQRCLPDRESDYSPVRETPADNYDLPLKHKGSHQIKLNNEAGLASKHAKAKNVVITRSSMNKSAANSMPMVYDPSVIDEGKLFQQKVFSRPDGSIHIERLQPPRQTMLAACSSTESTYPGLHIYVTESPPRPYYDVVSSFESPETHAPRRTIACDPITISCLPCAATKSERTISPIPRKQRGEKENVEARINLMRKSFEQIQPHSVASRVEAFTALLKPKEQKNLSESNCTIRSTPEITENRIKSLNDDRCKERTYSHLQRSATINYGKSGYLTVPKITEYCFTCCKRIYPVDRVSIEDRVYHKGCFRCATCQRIVLPGNFASLDGIILCKPHYIEQFRLSGNYSAGYFEDEDILEDENMNSDRSQSKYRTMKTLAPQAQSLRHEQNRYKSEFDA